MMLNVVADEVGVGAAVLIRSCAPVSGNFTPCLYLNSFVLRIVCLMVLGSLDMYNVCLGCIKDLRT